MTSPSSPTPSPKEVYFGPELPKLVDLTSLVNDYLHNHEDATAFLSRDGKVVRTVGADGPFTRTTITSVEFNDFTSYRIFSRIKDSGLDYEEYSWTSDGDEAFFDVIESNKSSVGVVSPSDNLHLIHIVETEFGKIPKPEPEVPKQSRLRGFLQRAALRLTQQN
ncbi:MAG TPA: hypothetical protein PL051_02090 [Candidatus Saccharibacteria bacterium]|nr:hypothetical protein [Candidatus Saccharibacteria bacterium]